MSGKIISLDQIQARYPNLVQQCRFVAHLTPYESRLLIWHYKNHFSCEILPKKINPFGGIEHLISQAFRYRNA